MGNFLGNNLSAEQLFELKKLKLDQQFQILLEKERTKVKIIQAQETTKQAQETTKQAQETIKQVSIAEKSKLSIAQLNANAEQDGIRGYFYIDLMITIFLHITLSQHSPM
jgi:hypothetical protein